MKVRLPRIEVQPTARCSLACLGCSHYSPQRAARGERDRDPADYARHLERLREFADWPSLFVGGGEPFLARDLAGWIEAVNGGPWRRPVHAITNGFWLLRKDWRSFASGVLSGLAALVVSRYPPYVGRLGVSEWDARLDALRADFPGLAITSFHGEDPAALRFTRQSFRDEPAPVPSPMPCALKWCLQLLPGGVLAKCPLGIDLEAIPNATGAFRDAYRARSRYDLSRLPEGLEDFASTEVHPACRLCGLATGGHWDAPWRNAPEAATATRDGYEALIRGESRDRPGTDPDSAV